MRITKLRLKGFTGIKKGLGQEEIEIDFSSLSGLVAIAGPNGNGKTTILDSMQPFRTLASRKRSLQHHVYLRDSEKELEFNFNGDQYRSLIKIDAESDRSEGYLWKNGESLVDGKVTNYDQEIIKLFGSPALFFNSVFCAQNSEKLNEMTTGDLKKLFSEFLRLDQLVDCENTSKQSALLLGNKLEKMEPIVSQLLTTVQGKEDATIEMGSAKVQLDMATASLKRLKIDLETKQTDLQKAQAAIQKNELLQDREKELNAKAIRLKNESETFEVKAEAEISVNLTKIRDIELEIMGLDSLLANEKEIRAAAKRVRELTGVIEDITKQGVEAREKEKEVEARHKIISTSVSKVELKRVERDRDARYKIDKMQTQIRACKDKMSDLDKKDPACQSTVCSFIVGALEAEKQLPTLEKELSESQATKKLKADGYRLEYDRLKDSFKEIEDELEEKHLVIEDITNTYKSLDQGLKKNQSLANELPRTEVAAQRKDDYKKRLEEMKTENVSLKNDHAKQRYDIADWRSEVAEKLNKITRDIDIEAKTRHDQTTQGIEKLKLDINNCDAGLIPSLQADITAATRRLEEIEVAEKELAGTVFARELYTTEASEWTYLKNACSKDGLRALEIDSVAPVVTGYANELLLATFGPTFSVRFRTQDEETGREVLDIMVIREDGSEILLDNLSGGEKLWVLQSLRLAMTLISKEKSGRTFETIFCDEFDGPIDINNAQNFIGLYRSMMDLGDFKTCFFISHKQECIGMANNTISLDGSGISYD